MYDLSQVTVMSFVLSLYSINLILYLHQMMDLSLYGILNPLHPSVWSKLPLMNSSIGLIIERMKGGNERDFSMTKVGSDTLVTCGEGGHIIVWDVKESRGKGSITHTQVRIGMEGRERREGDYR